MVAETVVKPETETTVVETEEQAKPAEGEEFQEPARTEGEQAETPTEDSPEPEAESEEDKRIRAAAEALRAEERAKEEEENRQQQQQERRRKADEEQRQKTRDSLSTTKSKVANLLTALKDELDTPLIPDAVLRQVNQEFDELGLSLRDGIKLGILEEAHADRDGVWVDLLSSNLSSSDRGLLDKIVNGENPTVDEIARTLGDLSKPQRFVQEARELGSTYLPETYTRSDGRVIKPREAFLKEAESLRTVKGIMDAAQKHFTLHGRRLERDTPSGEPGSGDGRVAGTTFSTRYDLDAAFNSGEISREVYGREKAKFEAGTRG